MTSLQTMRHCSSDTTRSARQVAKEGSSSWRCACTALLQRLNQARRSPSEGATSLKGSRSNRPSAPPRSRQARTQAARTAGSKPKPPKKASACPPAWSRCLSSSRPKPKRRQAARSGLRSGSGAGPSAGGEGPVNPPRRSRATRRSKQRAAPAAPPDLSLSPLPAAGDIGNRPNQAAAASSGASLMPEVPNASASCLLLTRPSRSSSRLKSWAKRESGPEHRAKARRKVQRLAASVGEADGNGPRSTACETEARPSARRSAPLASAPAEAASSSSY
mmetsp:Transcript_11853/g.26277  ORF Transcript_11853/g.26277 Transcript_11853/m.26277 type:complete len:276 (+) Transcript_11853:145-972(+)